MTRTAILVTVLSVCATAGEAAADKAMTAEHRLAWEAAQALYGEGLTVTKRRGKVVIGADPSGGLTQEAFNRYVEEVYLPAIASLTYRRTKGDLYRWAEHYDEARFDPRGGTVLAALLLEPKFKHALCERIVRGIGMRPSYAAQVEREDFCAYHAILEANAPLYDYRGAKVAYDASRSKGDLAIDDVVFAKDADGNYPIVVTVAGPGTIDARVTVEIQRDLLKKMDSDYPHRDKAHARVTRALRTWETKQKRVARKQRRLARGAKAVFFDHEVFEWDAATPAKGPIACKEAHFLVWAPAKKRESGYHLAIEVDGKQCKEYSLFGGETFRDEVYQRLACDDRVFTAGEHRLAVAVYLQHDAGDYTQTEVRDGRLEDVEYTSVTKGKKVFGESITCTVE